MKSIIFCTSFIDDNNYDRYVKWINYYSSKLDLFYSSNLFLIDDGSSKLNFGNKVEILKSNNLPVTLDSNINLFHFADHLGRPSRRDYKGWWRSFTFSLKLAEKYNVDKIIHIESDFYIISQRMIEYMVNVSEGWTVFYSNFYNFPETAIQIICKDSFEKFNKIYKQAVDSNYRFRRIAERVLPFSKIEKGFLGDRLGEIKVMQEWLRKTKLPLEIDYIGQIDGKDDPDVYKRFFQLHL